MEMKKEHRCRRGVGAPDNPPSAIRHLEAQIALGQARPAPIKAVHRPAEKKKQAATGCDGLPVLRPRPAWVRWGVSTP
jgi:hypothetical protein